MSTKRKYITEFIGLDLLRFILSVAVVIRHYIHFYGPFSSRTYEYDGSVMTEQPFYNVLGILYHHGHYAVQVFWLISGLIFYSIYHEEILNKKISFGNFSFLRFTRLYPLHLLTLLGIIFIQFSFFRVYHTYFFVDQAFDLKHFFLQLFFMGSWFPSLEHSFNIPFWSVSIEIFVYIVFYLITLAGLTKGKGLFLVLFVALLFNFDGILPPFNESLLYFFFGCLLARLIQAGIPLKSLLIRYILVSIACIVLVKVLRYFVAEDSGIFSDHFLLIVRLIPITSSLVLIFILTFHAITSKRITSFFRNLGNMTYSLYLVHYPIQVTIFLLLRPNSYTVFNSPKILILFLASSILVGWLAYEYFEKPVQKYLRFKFSNRTSNKETTVEQVTQFTELKS